MAKLTPPLEEFDIYDFDKTIYKGDCSLDFYFFCIRRQPGLLAYLPYQLWHLALFILRLESRTSFKSHFFRFLRRIDNINRYVDHFWGSHNKNIKQWYGRLDHSNDVIVSASPEFLLRPAFLKLKARLLIATRLDPKTGTIEGQNCRGEEKVRRLRQVLKEPVIRRVYTDSLSDLPLLALAKERYIVKGDQILSLEDYARKPRLKKLSLPDPID